VAAALADGTSVLRGAGLSDDSAAMIDCLRALGATIEVDGTDVTVEGVAGRPRGDVDVFTRLSGTTSRFITAVAALADGPVRIDALPPMRARPMGDLVDALRALGVTVDEPGEPGHLPLTVTGPITGDEVEVPGTVSSQYTSGLLLAAGGIPDAEGFTIRIGGDRLVSAPYTLMTGHVMEAFGQLVAITASQFDVVGTGYLPTEYDVEADAATAGYFLSAAAITGGTVTVPGLPGPELQADVALVGVLAAMGCEVAGDGRDVAVTGPAGGRLTGGQTFDLTAFSDMAPTVAVLGAFADGPVEVTGVGFIRGKETDRIAASVEQLHNLGVDAEETPDGFVVRPGATPHGAVIETYDDHRMAMSFALVGLVVPGISVADPTVVGKTHPGFWDDLERLRG